jgi:hypothetical protein
MNVDEPIDLSCVCGATVRLSICDACNLGWIVSEKDETIEATCPAHSQNLQADLQQTYDREYFPTWEVRDPDGKIVGIHMEDPRRRPGVVQAMQTVTEISWMMAVSNIEIQRASSWDPKNDPLMKITVGTDERS